MRRNLLRYGVGFIGAGFLQVLLETKAKGFTNSQKVQLLTFDPQTKQSANECGVEQFIIDQFKGFDAKQAYDLAELIDRIYNEFNRENKDNDNLSLPEDFSLIKNLYLENISIITKNFPFIDIKKENTFVGFVAINKNNKKVFIIFRGTQEINEWVNNTKFPLQDYKSLEGRCWGRAHKGIYLMYIGEKENGIRKDIKEALKKLKEQYEYDHIFVAGHSLGGALATLTIPDLIDSDINREITVYTFGSPRCSNDQLANKLNNSGVKHWRINNTEDFVTSLPWSPTPEKLRLKFLPRYQHTGIPISFTIGRGEFLKNHNLQETYMEGIGQPKIPGSLIPIH